MKKEETPSLFLENQLCFPLYATSRLITKIYTPYLNELDITYPQYLVLLALWQFNDQSVTEIGQRLYLETNTLTPLLKRLEAKGLIRRTRSKSDERTVVVSLTKAGEDLKSKAVEIPQKIIDSFSHASMSEEELITFQKTLFSLLKTLGGR